MRKIISALLSLTLLAGILVGCGVQAADVQEETNEMSASVTQDAAMKTPKYVFLFIGDGMSYPQIQSTADYLGALKDEDYWQAAPSLDDNAGAILDGPEYLNFMNF